MKKRMLSLLLTMALLLSFAVAPAYAAETVENTTPVTEQCPCGCGKTLAQVTWKSWDGNPKEGHYYLDGNFVQPDIATQIDHYGSIGQNSGNIRLDKVAVQIVVTLLGITVPAFPGHLC